MDFAFVEDFQSLATLGRKKRMSQKLETPYFVSFPFFVIIYFLLVEKGQRSDGKAIGVGVVSLRG